MTLYVLSVLTRNVSLSPMKIRWDRGEVDDGVIARDTGTGLELVEAHGARGGAR